MYKFYTIPDTKTVEYIIGDNPTIKFSSAFNLNDPYELKFNLIINPYADGQWEEYQKFNQNSSEGEFKSWQEQVKDNDGFIWYTEQEQRNHLAQTITLCSFTNNNKNNLMWSHYTNNHRGICVEYSEELVDFFKSNDSFFAYDKVRYSELPPGIDSLEEIGSKISKMMFNKQKEWKYEQEFRIIMLSKNDTDYLSIDPKFIKAVYIGAKAENSIAKRVLELCSIQNIKVFYGITLGDTYEVNFKEHKDGTGYMRTFWQ